MTGGQRAPRVRQAATFAVGLLSASVLLAACAGPDIAELESDAESAFDALVGVAGATEEGILRTLEVASPEEQPCGEQDRGVQRVFTAVGSVSVGADYAAEDALVDAVTEEIDPEEWTPIDADGIAGKDGAWVDESGIVATVSYDSPILVIAVFTPCLDAP
ncbi:hypothetical protein [Microbacterium sp. NPDC076895]|uniref:hypothetical protein n=1 Tax=Microbacterium sp. NPDC076895 TaxID=3154957 RepID=UPI0034235991